MTDILNIDNPDPDNEDVRAWLEIRKQAALRIDPQTAEVECVYGNPFDPYGVRQSLPPEVQDIIREMFFARSPGTDVWVYFEDLPKATYDALWMKIESGQCARQS